jgi:hypothetical protein
MDDVLLGIVLGRLAESPLPDQAADLLLAALDRPFLSQSELEAFFGSPSGLTAALQHQATHGDGACPVCGRPGALTMPWRQATENEVTRLLQEASAAESAGHRHGSGPGRLAALDEPAGCRAGRRRGRVARHSRSPEPGTSTAHPRDPRPVGAGRRAARAIWTMLLQESNVDLGAIWLAGSATQRRVELDVSVDGAPGSAGSGVSSQERSGWRTGYARRYAGAHRVHEGVTPEAGGAREGATRGLRPVECLYRLAGTPPGAPGRPGPGDRSVRGRRTSCPRRPRHALMARRSAGRSPVAAGPPGRL